LDCHPDLDALTVLHYGGLDGKCNIHSKNLKREKVVIEKGTYVAICSMNTAFVSKIIPAFYHLYMNHIGIDRFDDIWSGIFLKKIADHLGDNVSLGKPLVYHNKRPRNVFKDLRNELEGMVINETLWRIVEPVCAFYGQMLRNGYVLGGSYSVDLPRNWTERLYALSLLYSNGLVSVYGG
jgi:hypothetical protein